MNPERLVADGALADACAFEQRHEPFVYGRVRGGFRTRVNVQWARLIWRTLRRSPDLARAGLDAAWEEVHHADAYRVLPPDGRWQRSLEQLRR